VNGDVRIVGLGSPNGDDRAGWAALAALTALPLPDGLSLHRCTTPAADLLAAMAGASRVVLIDAVAGGVTGTLVRGGRADLADRRGTLSSHGVALNTLLDLAEACGLLPPELTWVAVAIDPDAAAGEALSAPVAAAVPALARAALEEALRGRQTP
jgi:hydrogenase maturation protease